MKIEEEPSLQGIQAKYDRAREQFDELRTGVYAFFNTEPKPYSSVGEFDRDTWEWVERIQVKEEPPLRFGVMLGDSLLTEAQAVHKGREMTQARIP